MITESSKKGFVATNDLFAKQACLWLAGRICLFSWAQYTGHKKHLQTAKSLRIPHPQPTRASPTQLIWYPRNSSISLPSLCYLGDRIPSCEREISSRMCRKRHHHPPSCCTPHFRQTPTVSIITISQFFNHPKTFLTAMEHEPGGLLRGNARPCRTYSWALEHKSR